METEKPTGRQSDDDQRPLWTCPRCGHRFVTANMWHSCTNYTLEEAFARSTPELRLAFERFVRLAERCGTVTVIAQKTRIVLQARVRFAGATVLRDRLRLNFALTRKHEAPWITRIETYGTRWNAHHFEIRGTTDLDALDELPSLLCESYNDLGRQESLRRSARPEPPIGRAVVLVEGASDQRALEALAERHGRSLGVEGISIVPMGGAQAIGTFLERFGPRGLDLVLAGLCDAAEEDDFKRGIERAGLGSDLTRAEMERLGFFVCVADLEDELVRALGSGRVEEVIESQGELESFRTFQKQLEKRGLTREEQLHGFMWNRKIRYAPLLVGALDLANVPRPLERVLAHV